MGQLKKLLEKENFYTWLTAVFLFLQWVMIALTSVNVPAGDEWEYLKPEALPKGFSWEFLFSFHNEHRGVFSRLQNFVSYYVSDWNLLYQIHFNYLLYCLIVCFLFFFQKKNFLNADKGLWFLLFFMASPINIDNHNWAFQSFFHYCIGFSLLALFYATKENIKTWDYWWASLFAVLASYSLASGIFFAFMVLLVLLFRLSLLKVKTASVFTFRFMPLGLMLLSLFAWFYGYHRPPGHPELTWPTQLDFWNFYANLISFGFGYKSTNPVISLLALLLVLVILVLSFKKAFRFQEHKISFPFFATLAILLTFASIALSRTTYGLGQAKTSRYAELAILLTPFIGWLWWNLSQDNAYLKKFQRTFFWFILLGFAGSFDYGKYFSTQTDRQQGLACIVQYYRGENKTGFCPVLYPGPLAERLEIAKKLKLSWVPAEAYQEPAIQKNN